MKPIIPILLLALALTASASLDVKYHWQGTGSADWQEDYNGVRQGWAVIGAYDASGQGMMTADEDSATSDVSLEGRRGSYYSTGKAGPFSSSLKVRNAKALNVSASAVSTGEDVDQTYDVAGIGSASIRVIGTDQKGHPLARVSGDISGQFAGSQGVYRIGADETPQDALVEIYTPVYLDANETEEPAASDIISASINDTTEPEPENVTYQEHQKIAETLLEKIAEVHPPEDIGGSEAYAALLESIRRALA